MNQKVMTTFSKVFTQVELAKLFEHVSHYPRVAYLMPTRTGLRDGEFSECIFLQTNEINNEQDKSVMPTKGTGCRLYLSD